MPDQPTGQPLTLGEALAAAGMGVAPHEPETDPVKLFHALDKELKALTDRSADSERRVKSREEAIRDLEKRLAALREVEKSCRKSGPALAEKAAQLEKKAEDVEGLIAEERGRLQTLIKLCGQAKRLLAEFPHERYGEYKGVVTALEAADRAARGL